jgi:hypothetical protein
MRGVATGFLIALAFVFAGSGSGAISSPVRTLITTSSEIDAFAADGEDLAWITRRGRCGPALHIRPRGAQRPVTIQRVVCHPNKEQAGLTGDLALARGRALWSIVTDFSHQAFGISMRTASVSNPHVTALPCCDLEYAESPDELPSWALAGRGSMLVYYSHSGLFDRTTDGAVMRVRGRKSSKLFGAHLPVDLAVDKGRIALVRSELKRGDGCGCNFKPVWSPDGSKIAFLRTNGAPNPPQVSSETVPEAAAQLAVMNADGTRLTPLTDDGRWRNAVDWSNDGTLFVYAYSDEYFENQRIAVATADGAASRDIAFGYHPRWSPVGSTIVFEQDETIFTVNSDGGGRRQLGRGEEPSWSPDGTRIAFIRDLALYTMRADGTGVRRLDERAFPEDPAWSPDGRTIAYAGESDFKSGLFIVNADGSGRRRLTNHEGDRAPDWSPDGRTIVFSSTRNDLIGDDERYESEIYSIGADGRGLRLLTAARASEWTTAGEIRSAGGALIGTFAASGRPRAVALAGSTVALLAADELKVFDARTGASRGGVRLPPRARSDLGASGRWAVFSALSTIRAVDLRTRAVRVLARTRGTPIGLSISGRRVTWAENRGGRGRIHLVSLPR